MLFTLIEKDQQSTPSTGLDRWSFIIHHSLLSPFKNRNHFPGCSLA